MDLSQCAGGQCCLPGQKDCIQSCCPEDGGKEFSHVEELMGVAKSAKKELLKEKIKAQLEKQVGKKFDQVAELMATTLIEAHKDKMASALKKKSAMEKFKDLVAH